MMLPDEVSQKVQRHEAASREVRPSVAERVQQIISAFPRIPHPQTHILLVLIPPPSPRCLDSDLDMLRIQALKQVATKIPVRSRVVGVHVGRRSASGKCTYSRERESDSIAMAFTSGYAKFNWEVCALLW